MRMRTFLAAFAMLLLLAACKKNHSSTGPSVSDYLQLKQGNYWVNESYRTDSNGDGQPGGGFTAGQPPFYDSLYVAADTAFGGHTWHVLMAPDPGTMDYAASYMRDSLSYEVNNYGRVLLAPYDYTSILYRYVRGQTAASADSASVVTEQMGDLDKAMTVPAGTFTTSALMTLWTFYPFAASGDAVHYRKQYARYAVGVGLVSQTLPFYSADPLYTERRLVRYRVHFSTLLLLPTTRKSVT